MDGRILAIALLAVLAGCGSVIGADGARDTVTPAPVATPDPARSVGPADIAPGVTTAGIEDEEELFNSHVAVTNDTTFEWTARYRQDYGQTGSFEAIEVRSTTFQPTDDGYRSKRIQRLITGGEQRFVHIRTVVVDDDGRYVMTTVVNGSERSFYRTNRSRDPSQFTTPTRPIRFLLVVQNQTVSRVDVGERPHFLITGSRESIDQNAERVALESRTIVREDGLIRRLNVSFVGIINGEEVPSQYNLTYSNVGSAQLDEPDWLAEAKRETTAD